MSLVNTRNAHADVELASCQDSLHRRLAQPSLNHHSKCGCPLPRLLTMCLPSSHRKKLESPLTSPTVRPGRLQFSCFSRVPPAERHLSPSGRAPENILSLRQYHSKGFRYLQPWRIAMLVVSFARLRKKCWPPMDVDPVARRAGSELLVQQKCCHIRGLIW